MKGVGVHFVRSSNESSAAVARSGDAGKIVDFHDPSRGR
jgi:hypothetical protein